MLNKMINSKIKFAGLFFVGPIGCYLTYQYFFVFRFLGSSQYENISSIYQQGGYLIEITLMLLGVIGVCKLAPDVETYSSFISKKKNLPVPVLCLLTAIVAAMIILTIYRVLGSLNIKYLIENFDLYYMENTVGMAWMILLCYTMIYAILIDMYFGGANKKNATFLIISILIVSINGGRGVLMLFALTFLIMLLYQQVSWKNFILASLTCSVALGYSYVTVTSMRSPVSQAAKGARAASGNVKPTDSFYDLNYNAAFILEDVVNKLDNHEASAGPYMLKDLSTVFIPRILYPAKPKSTAETEQIYPDVAARGTNITFPLKANILMHLGRWSFYVDWVVVFFAQMLLYYGLKRRQSSPDIAGFIMVVCGGVFSLAARGGVFNARLFVQLACILGAYLGYRILIKVTELYAQWIRGDLAVPFADKLNQKKTL